MRTKGISRPARHIGPAALAMLAVLASCGGLDNPTAPRVIMGFGGTLPFISANPADGSTFLSAFNSGSLTSH